MLSYSSTRVPSPPLTLQESSTAKGPRQSSLPGPPKAWSRRMVPRRRSSPGPPSSLLAVPAAPASVSSPDPPRTSSMPISRLVLGSRHGPGAKVGLDGPARGPVGGDVVLAPAPVDAVVADTAEDGVEATSTARHVIVARAAVGVVAVAGPSAHGVVATVAADLVAIGPTVHFVGAATAVDGVVAPLAVDRVVAAPAVDPVTTEPAANHVVAADPDDDVGTTAADDHVGRLGAVNHAVVGGDRRLPSPAQRPQRLDGAGEDETETDQSQKDRPQPAISGRFTRGALYVVRTGLHETAFDECSPTPTHEKPQGGDRCLCSYPAPSSKHACLDSCKRTTGSNPRPQAWEACALPTELRPRWR